MQRKSTYYTRLLLSYALAVSIPVVLLCAVIYNISFTRLQEEIISGQRLLLTQAAESLNLRMRDSNEMSNVISIDNEIINLSESRAPDQIMQGVSLLRKYTAGNTFLENIIVKHGGEETLYTASGTVFESVLLTRKYGFTVEEQVRFAAFTSDEQKHLHYFEDGKCIMRFVPIPVFAKQKSGCAIFVINQDAFTRLFASDVKRRYGALLLLDDRQEIIYQLDQDGIVTDDLLHDALYNLGNTAFTNQGETYQLISLPVKEANWLLVSMVPNSFIQGKLYNIFLIGVTLVALVLAVVLSFVSARYQYKPIRALSRTIYGGTGAPSSTNELESIRQAIDSSMVLGEQVELQRIMLRESLLLRLLHGDIPGKEELKAAFHALHLPMGARDFRVVILQVQGWQQGKQARLMAHIRETCQVQGNIYGVEDSSKQRIMLVMHYGGEGTQDRLPAILDALYSYVKDVLMAECSFGIGNAYSFDRIAASYLEASVALDHQEKEGPQRMVFYSSLKNTSQFLDDFQRQEVMLIHAIRLANRPMTNELLETILETMGDRYTSRNLSSYYRLRLIEALVRLSTEDTYTSIRQEEEMERLSALVVVILSPCTHEEYARSMREAVDILLDMTERAHNQEETNDMVQVQQWIENNIREPDLSLDLLSQDMGYSPAYWSRFCREKLHISFQEHIWQLRLGLTKEALMNTNIPIKQIVMNVGYLDVSTFIRRFRQETGMTPGQFRTLDRQNKNQTGGSNE